MSRTKKPSIEDKGNLRDGLQTFQKGDHRKIQ
jgi:hypothetical protein